MKIDIFCHTLLNVSHTFAKMYCLIQKVMPSSYPCCETSSRLSLGKSINMKCRQSLSESPPPFFPAQGLELFFFNLLTDLSKTEPKLVHFKLCYKHSLPYMHVAQAFPESKNELWNCDASISSSFIGMLWLFLINLFSAGLGNRFKITSNCSFLKLWIVCFVCWDSKNQLMCIRKKWSRKRII